MCKERSKSIGENQKTETFGKIPKEEIFFRPKIIERIRKPIFERPFLNQGRAQLVRGFLYATGRCNKAAS